MRVFKYELTQDDGDAEGASMTIIVETDRGGSMGFTRDEVRDVVTGAPEAKGTIRLRSDQRVLIESRVQTHVLDRENFAAIDPNAQREEPKNVADDPSKELPHPDNNQAVKQELDRMTAAAKINKADAPHYGPPPRTEAQVTRTVTPPPPTPKTEKVTVRTPATGVKLENPPKPDEAKPSATGNVTP